MSEKRWKLNELPTYGIVIFYGEYSERDEAEQFQLLVEHLGKSDMKLINEIMPDSLNDSTNCVCWDSTAGEAEWGYSSSVNLSNKDIKIVDCFEPLPEYRGIILLKKFGI